MLQVAGQHVILSIIGSPENCSEAGVQDWIMKIMKARLLVREFTMKNLEVIHFETHNKGHSA